ncbi:ataxin-7-like protein 2 isoform X2 [Hemicordylus capensis]|uniref:ataxin-7-like protein 2 isoform X2 n=1 Tax=Hemicordylus capensis TaxID=884348 RepID=UPI00230386F4|nr:ataxin-7-like protein 2 isoform X2 [Hemicordylus capensis]
MFDFLKCSLTADSRRGGETRGAVPGSELEEINKNGSKKLDAMTLIKEDMSIFGHCPAHDEFYLVVCNHCGQVVKPQAFQKHCERRHGPLGKLCARVQTSSNLQKCHAINGRSLASGGHGSTKSWREKSQSSFSQGQHPPERPDKMPKDNPCLFVPVVNLEKISSLSKPDGIKALPKPSDSRQSSASTKEILGKPSLVASPKEPLVPAKAGGSSIMPADSLGRKLESTPTFGEKEPGAVKSLKKMPRKECDLNRQCGVLNPETKKICTRLLTCKIHSVHQRREVQGRAKDFDVLVAELKANARKGESSKDKSPVRKEAASERLSQDSSSLSQTSLVLPHTSPCRIKQPYSHCALSRSRVSSESDPDDPPPTSSEVDHGLYPFPAPKGTGRISSEESEDDALEDSHKLDCHYATRSPRPQAFCTFGSRLVSPGCYVFSRRLDRFCSALSSMLERHLSSHMWNRWHWTTGFDDACFMNRKAHLSKGRGETPGSEGQAKQDVGLVWLKHLMSFSFFKATRRRIPPAADHQMLSMPSSVLLGFSTPSTSQSCNSSLVCSLPHSIPGRASVSCAASATMASRDSRSHHSMNYAVGSPHAAAACSQPDCMGGNQSITSPLPANTPSPSFSKLPLTKASKSSKARELAGSMEPEALAQKRKQSSAPASPPYKQTCFLDLGKSKAAGCQISHPSAKAKPSVISPSTLALNGAASGGARIKRVGHLDCRSPSHVPVRASQLENRGSSLNGPKALQANCISDEEAKRRKNTATYCRPVKAKHSPAPLPSPSSSDLGGSVRRKKPVVSLGFEEKQNTMKSKAH